MSTQTDQEDPPSAQPPQTTAQPDFSLLPEALWVKILQMVSIQDRYHLSLTCSRLHSLFGVPEVWQYGTMYFGPFHRKKNPVILAKKFGHFFNSVILEFDDLSLDSDSLTLLTELSSKWNLKSLVIKIGIPVVQSIFKRKYEAVLRSLHFKRISQQLKHLEFIVPCATDIKNDLAFWGFRSISELLSGSLTLFPQLVSVRLGCPIVYKLKTDDLSLPAPLTSSLLSLVPRLQTLELSAFNFNDNLLHQLAQTFGSQGQLRTLILDVFAFNMSSQLPRLSCPAWRELICACPSLQVSCVLRCPLAQRPAHVRSLIPPEAEVPLVSVRVGTCRCQTEEELRQALELAREHPQSLHTFVGSFEGLDEQFENAVVTMATECIHLCNLAYRGEIHYEQVMKIASLDRQWRSLEFCQGRIVTDDRQRVCHSVDKEILYKWSRPRDPDIEMTKSRRVKLDNMSSVVSAYIQHPWKPIIEHYLVGKSDYP